MKFKIHLVSAIALIGGAIGFIVGILSMMNAGPELAGVALLIGSSIVVGCSLIAAAIAHSSDLKRRESSQ